jgi:cell division inhibitor SepF
MSNAMRRVANYLGLMDDPEFDTPQTATTNTPAIPPTGDVRVKTREPRSVGSLRHSSVVEVAPQLDLHVITMRLVQSVSISAKEIQ